MPGSVTSIFLICSIFFSWLLPLALFIASSIIDLTSFASLPISGRDSIGSSAISFIATVSAPLLPRNWSLISSRSSLFFASKISETALFLMFINSFSICLLYHKSVSRIKITFSNFYYENPGMYPEIAF